MLLEYLSRSTRLSGHCMDLKNILAYLFLLVIYGWPIYLPLAFIVYSISKDSKQKSEQFMNELENNRVEQLVPEDLLLRPALGSGRDQTLLRVAETPSAILLRPSSDGIAETE